MVLAPNPGLCNTRTTEGELSNGLNRVQASKSTSLRDKLAECHSYTTKSLKASCVFHRVHGTKNHGSRCCRVNGLAAIR